MSAKLIRTIHPETRVLDEKTGLVEYVASDETVDSYREVIRASGWRFDYFKQNAPFVDSHNYESVDRLLGKVVDFRVSGGRLVETVQWAVDVPENRLAQLGWKMTAGGYLRAVSVGFYGVKVVTPYRDPAAFQAQLEELGMTAETDVRAIYLEQQQVELSAVVIGANPNALARSYKAGVLVDDDLDFLSREIARRQCAGAADGSDAAAQALHRRREEFARKIQQAVKGN